MSQADLRGKVQSVIRDQLPKLRREMQEALNGAEYESAWFDQIARKLADAVVAAMEPQAAPLLASSRADRPQASG